MDEEKQNNGVIKKAGDALKEQAKNRVKKYIKKIIMGIAAVILKVVIPILLAILIFNFLADWFDKFLGTNSKEAQTFSVSYSYTTSSGKSNSSGTSSSNGSSASGGGKSGTVNIKLAPAKVSNINWSNIQTDDPEEQEEINAAISNSNTILNEAYYLTYEFKNESGEVYTEKEALETIKKDLISENADLDMLKFSDSELKIIGCLMYNGLEVDKYDEEELKALALFFKAEIASQNFDLRSADKIGEEVDIEEMSNSDYVYGTLQMHRTKAAEGLESETPLEYIPYGDENTEGTFCYMDANDDEEILNKFSIDEEGRAVFARYSSVNTTYVYRDANGIEMSESEILENIPEKNRYESKSTTSISAIPFNYKQYITQYTVNYGLLSDLMIITDNVEFCTEIAKLSFNGKLVINIEEGLSITTSYRKTTVTETKLIYDYVTYNVSGQKENKTITQGTTPLMRINGSLSDSSNANNKKKLEETYGWSSSMSCRPVNGNSSGGTTLYEWTHEGKSYRLYHTSTLSYETWSLYEMIINTTYTNLPPRDGTNELINLDNNHINIKYEFEDDEESGYTIDEDYTKQEIYKYVIEMNSYSENRPCSYQISEVDSWYIKYKKEYNAPEPINSGNSRDDDHEGMFPEEKENVLTTIDANEIANEISKRQEIQDFIKLQESEYANDKSAVNVQCNITELTIEQRVKEDMRVESNSATSGYKFADDEDEDEEVDTTKAQLKNVEYIGEQPTFTKEDGEIGFLYIYDDYVQQDEDVFLEEDAETRLFEMLEDDTTTSQYSSVIKFLLYVYDGKDRGVTNLSMKIIDLEAMNKVKGSSTLNYVMMWENGGLWEYITERTSIFPYGYLSEDEECYIVYEDNSRGHNNIAYGIATFIEGKKEDSTCKYNSYFGKYGHYYHHDPLSNLGIDDYSLQPGDAVPRDAIDSYFVSSVQDRADRVNKYLEENLPEYSFTRAQKDALVSIMWQYGNIIGFADAYKNSLNADGELDAEKIKNEFHVYGGSAPFDYEGHNDGWERKWANYELFTTGKYYDFRGNEIKFDDIVSKAQEIHDYMSDPAHLYYYCIGGKEKEVNVHRNAGLPCFTAYGSWEASKIEGGTCYRLTCCATFVSWVLEELELVDGHNDGVAGLEAELKSKNWIIINEYSQLEPGDIVVTDNADNPNTHAHVQIYVGDDQWYNAGGNYSIQLVEPQKGDASSSFQVAYRRPY